MSKHKINNSVGTLIYSIKTKRYLFLLRDGVKFSGTWGLVGGKIEKNESAIEALHREMREELGGIILDPKIIPIEKFTSPDHAFTYHTFVIPVDDEFVPELNSEHRGYCWVKLTDLPKPLHPGFWKTINFDSVLNKLSVLESILEIEKGVKNNIR
jgi:8-oxo-dGTP pyrophosphatase MutT (NUDIX family)